MKRELTKGEVDEIEHAFEHMERRVDEFIKTANIKPSDGYALAAATVKERHAEIVTVLRERLKD